MADLGDISNFLKEGALADLDWLDVNEETYRDQDRLPKQNLNVEPDLKALWRHQDEPASSFVPNTGEARTMGDLSELHGRLRSEPEDLIRTARLAIMQSTDTNRIKHALTSRYDSQTLGYAKTALSTVLAERGLLGRLYIAASDFPDCDKGSRQASEFVRRYANEAPYVIAKQACGDCTHHQVQGNKHHCGVFHKELQVEVPYTDALASEVENRQLAMGRAVQASVGSPKDRIRQAYLAADGTQQAAFTGRPQQAPVQVQVSNPGEVLIAASNLTKKRDEAARQQMLVAKARPIVAMLRREMLKGRGEAEVSHALRLAFDLRDLEETRSEWGPLFKEAGLYGAVYMTQDSFEDCREGADFIHKHASKVRAVVAGEKCGTCIFNQASRCMMYGRKLVANSSELLTPETVAAVLDEGRIAGRLPQEAHKIHWGSTPVEALKALHKAASAPPSPLSPSLRSTVETAFHGQGRGAGTSDLTKREVVRTASRYMNEGLYGSDLLMALRGKFDSRDLVASAQDLKVVLAEQGLMGFKYVDPSIYEDYGTGCKEAARLHRSRGAVKYAKIGDKCGSCVHQTQPGHCSVLAKQLVVEPPYMDKQAEQQAILTSGAATEPVPYEKLYNNGLSMMQEYQLQHQASEIDLNPEVQSIEADIEFGIQKLKL